MGICYYCYWGWPKPIADIFNKAVEMLGGNEDPLMFGPAHVVWSDENFNSASWCLENFEENRSEYYCDASHEVVRWSLEELAKLPMDLKTEPDGYYEDDEHPERYPPATEFVSVP